MSSMYIHVCPNISDDNGIFHEMFQQNLINNVTRSLPSLEHTKEV